MQYDEFKIYAIQHKETGRLITGTDLETWEQAFSPYYPPILINGTDVEFEFISRGCSPEQYRIVEVEVKVKGV